MKSIFVSGALLILASSAVAQDHVAGLLTLPGVFGVGPCDRFSPEEIRLYGHPKSSESIGVIRVDNNWRFPETGGCEGLRVNVHRGEGAASALPTREYDYEAPAAIVLEARDGWFKLLLEGGSGWISAPEQSEYYPLEALLSEKLTFITDSSEGRLFSRPGGDEQVVVASSGDPVRVVGFERVDDRPWVHVQVLSHSVCESADEPRVTSQGWMPAHGHAGEPAVWFYSRGC